MDEQQARQPIRVSVADTKEHYDKENVTILDVVDTVAYDKFPYQIQGAVRIKPEDIPDAYSRLPKDQAVFTY